jgi:TonB family protein
MAQSRFDAPILSRPALLLAIYGILCCGAATATVPDDALQSRYQGKQVMLRNFYCGNKLKFDLDGNLVEGKPSGAWTLCLDIFIDQIRVKHGKLEIEGQRIPLFYDSKRQQFRNVLEVADKKRESYKELVRMQEVSIEALLPPSADDQTLAAMLDKLFYASDKEFMEAAPDFWKPFFQRRADRKPGSNPGSDSQPPEGDQPQRTDSTGQASPAAADDGGGEVLHIGGHVKPPVAVYQPDPDYAADARLAGYQGTTTITIVIGPDGKVYRPRLSEPVGLGLDEQARDKVLTWKFKPATKDGQPVAVEVKVEVQFNLY